MMGVLQAAQFIVISPILCRLAHSNNGILLVFCVRLDWGLILALRGLFFRLARGLGFSLIHTSILFAIMEGVLELCCDSTNC